MSSSWSAVQAADVVRRPVQPSLLGTPEREPHGVGDLRLPTRAQRGLQHRRHAGPVVVDAGAASRTLSRCAPTMTTFLVSPVLVCATTFRDLIITALLSSTSRTGCVGAAQRRVRGRVDDPDRNGELLVVARREQPGGAADRSPGGADDEQPDRALGDGGVLLVDDRATGVVDDGDRALDRHRTVVGGRAAGAFCGRSVSARKPPGGVVTSSDAWSTRWSRPATVSTGLPPSCPRQPLELRRLDVEIPCRAAVCAT